MMQQITLQELENWQKEERIFQLIDVREKEEHVTYNIGGELIPLSEVMRNTSKLELSKPIIFYCKRGIRSQIAIQKLQRRLPEGNFFNLQNGICKFIY